MSPDVFRLLIIAVIVGMVVLVVIRGIQNARMRSEMRQRGVTTIAEITRLFKETTTSTDSDNNTTYDDTYTVEYRYSVDGTHYSNRERVPLRTYQSLQEGQRIEVVYLPEKPDKALRASAL